VSSIEEKVDKAIEELSEELGATDVVIEVEGSIVCEDCLRIEVNSAESFILALSTLVKQGLRTGALPIIVVKKRRSGAVDYYALSLPDRVVVEYISSGPVI